MNPALIISPEIPWPVRDGWSLRNYQLIRALSAQMICDLLVLSQNRTVRDFRNLATALNVRNVLAVPHKRKNKTLCALAGLVMRRPLGQVLYSSKWLKALTTEISSQTSYKVCLVLGDVCMAQYGPAVRGSPQLLWDLCDNFASSYNRRAALAGERASLQKLYYQIESRIIDRYVRAVSNTFDSILVISDKDAEGLRPEFAGRIATVTNAFQVDRECAKVHGDIRTLLFTGSMRSWANRDAAIFFIRDILPIVSERCDDVVFRVVGSGSEALDVFAKPNVSVTGYVDNLGPYYASCDVFVCPLRTGTGIKNKMLDAMATGCAIVTTSLGAEGLSLVHGRDALIADTATQFGAAVLLLLRDVKLRCQLGANARQVAEHSFSTEVVTEQMRRVLMEALHRSATGEI